ncbi:hypothetical protein GCM10010156_22380 [Planobispora rosea]|uniref:Uncharacterized protein n=1 Tax=Planobispora rosea TaxID=35762 RepID=A0A8J3S248_PLARO|nr:hypothetical protein GCM10010156_22380 [Planobispora rosea]GIH84402.1 hypothetical protein Pro02_28100 [Planobispora rosea]
MPLPAPVIGYRPQREGVAGRTIRPHFTEGSSKVTGGCIMWGARWVRGDDIAYPTGLPQAHSSIGMSPYPLRRARVLGLASSGWLAGGAGWVDDDG